MLKHYSEPVFHPHGLQVRLYRELGLMGPRTISVFLENIFKQNYLIINKHYIMRLQYCNLIEKMWKI